MKLSLTGSWSILLQTVQGASRSVSVFILLTHTAHAILDSNSNTLSDLWEKQFNNQQLFPTTAGHLPDDDPDGDGWTNIREAAAGTNPFEANPPDGIVRPAILHFPATSSVDPNDGTAVFTPEAFSISWPTVAGKQYALSASPDLTQEGWITIGPPFVAAGGTNTTTVPVTQPDGSVPEKLFWRIAVSDVDTDGDNLTDSEEHLLGTNPELSDTDFDGIDDSKEFDHSTSPNFWDTDGDGSSDGSELAGGKDPLLATSFPPQWRYVERRLFYGFGNPSAESNPPYSHRSSSRLWEPVANESAEFATELGWPTLSGNLELIYPFPGTPTAPRRVGLGTWTNFGQYNWLGEPPKVASITHRRYWLVSDAPQETPITSSFVKFTRRAINSGVPSETAELIETTISPNYTFSSPIDVCDGLLSNPSPSSNDSQWENLHVSLLPVEVAPEVLAVNSDFDEGRIDPATGYAIPDCDDIPGVDQKTGSGNTQIALNASSAHLDGLFANDEKVTDDMHKGWFGVNPNQLGDDFWAGANVTIRKLDKIDDETGYKESGQVRFYAKWSGGYYGISPYDFQTLQPVNLVSAGVNLRPGEGVYGASSTIPDGAAFYMEGVRPGKITLEWRLQKGTIDVKHEHTFKVETRKTLAEWREEVRYQIRLQTKVKTGSEVDIAAYHTGNGFRNTSGSQPVASDNVARVQAIYYYYQQLFKQMPEKFMWAGMAKTAAAPIYAGMSDMSSWLWATDPIPPDDDRDPGVDIFVKLLLLGGQKAIYEDKAWAHRAYLASGNWALDWVRSQTLANPPTEFPAWVSLDAGIQDSDQVVINQANHDLLQREQRDVIQTYYASYATPYFMKQPPSGFSFFGRWIEIVGAVHLTPNANGLVNTGEWLSANANKNPMPGGPKFRDIVPGGRIDNYQDRWNWTANQANGMLSIWTGEATDASVPKFNAGQRLSETNKTMYSAAAAYSYDTGGLPIE